MKLQSFLVKLINRYFIFNNEGELDETITLIVKGLKNLEHSNVTFSNSMILRQLNLKGNDIGLVFLEWNISATRRIFYLMTCKYPRMVNLSIRGNMVLLRVNGTKRQFLGEPTAQFKINNEMADRLEIDISDNFVKFSLKEKEL